LRNVFSAARKPRNRVPLLACPALIAGSGIRREAATNVGVHPSGCGSTLKRELQHRRRAARGGYVLVLVAVMLFALMALGALVIDFGMVRLTQRQMLAATDAAALEGLRWRDVQYQSQLPLGWQNNPAFWQAIGATSNSGGEFTVAQQDAIRRWAAASMISLMTTSNADDTADSANYGFGPQVQFTATAAGGGLAGPLVAPGQPPVYQPQLQTNSGNATNGDMVSGYYGPDQSGVEQSDYTRNDYSPVASSATSTAQPPSMLVRMRRVAPGNSLDQESGISSSGGTVPFLFGYGAAIDRTSANQGVTVRGTSIASVGFNPANNPEIPTSDPFFADYPTIGMANSAGWYNPTTGQIGVVPIAIYSDPAGGNDQWSPLVAGRAAVTLTVASDGMTLQTSSGQTVGFMVNQSTWVVTTGQSTSLSPVGIGQQVSASVVAPPASQSSSFALLMSAAHQVIGFGAADNFSYSPSTISGRATISLTPAQDRIAWTNASASIVQPLASSVNVPALWTLRAAVQYPLFSPVLVNR
jgi:hypothetical protein